MKHEEDEDWLVWESYERMSIKKAKGEDLWDW
jgi:hypothetical protein